MPITEIRYNGAVIDSTRNSAPVEIKYGNRLIASVNAGSTATLKCARKLLAANVMVGSKTCKTNGKETEYDIIISVGTKTKLNIPSISGSFTYDGNEVNILNSIVYDSTLIEITGDLKKTNAGSYSITCKLRDTEEYEWSDGSISDKTVNWSINKRLIANPSVTGSFTYDKNTHTATTNYDTTWVTQTGDSLTQTNAATYHVYWDLKDTTNTQWNSGGTAQKSGTWVINKKSITIPSISATSYQYTGSCPLVVSGFDSTWMTQSGGTEVNVGSGYQVSWTLKDSNTQWTGSNPNPATWAITKKVITVPTISSTSFTYDGNPHHPTVNGFDSTWMTQTPPTVNETNVGNYSISWALKDTTNTQWGSGQTTVNWTINQATLTTPAQSGTLTYSGNPQSPSWNSAYDSSKMNVSVTPQTNAGDNYTATFTITNSNYKFSSGSTANVTWKINKSSAAKVSVSPTSHTWDANGDYAFTITNPSGGALTAKSSATSYFTVPSTISGTSLTVTAKGQSSSQHTGTITITSAATTNYEQSTCTISCTLSRSSSCVSGDTLIMMGDGSQKPIKDVQRGDSIMTYNMDRGEFEPQDVVIYWDESRQLSPRSLHLTFDDGRVVKVIYEHGFFDKTANTYSYINYNNYEEFIGHEFVAYAEDGYKLVRLVNAEIVWKDIEQYSLESAFNDNFITEGLISMTQEPVVGRFEYFKFDEDEVKWDVQDKAEQIEQYGLYTYDEWKDRVPDEDLFNALNGPYFKILMDKGIVKLEDLDMMLKEVEDGMQDIIN